MEPDHRQIIRQQAETIRRQEQIIARQQARIAELEQRVAQLTARVEELSAQVAQLSKNSSTSSKPPSSDIVKPPKPPAPTGGRRHIGGQPGHRRHERLPFAPDQIDHLADYRLDRCPDCGARLRPMKRPPRTLQQVEIPEVPLTVTEHQAHAAWCPRCQRIHYAPLPPEVQAAGLVGPRLSALVAWLKGTGHGSFSTLAKFCRDVLGLSLSRGQLAKVIAKTSAAMQTAYEALAARLPEEPRLNVDETGHKENGRGLWTWCFRAEPYTLFRIAPSRGSQVLVDLLGREFAGVLGCDYFSAYRKYMGDFDVLVQFCLAHLIRDVKFLMTLPGREDQAYGRRVREALRELFAVIHRREKMTAAGFQKALEAARQHVMKAATTRVPSTRHAQNLAKRFREHGEAYFRFITTPGIEPTNNLAEQAIRFIVIDRRITQGTRSETGRRWCERIWTVIATCAQQGRSAFQFLLDSVQAHLCGTPPPSLMPSGP